MSRVKSRIQKGGEPFCNFQLDDVSNALGAYLRRAEDPAVDPSDSNHAAQVSADRTACANLFAAWEQLVGTKTSEDATGLPARYDWAQTVLMQGPAPAPGGHAVTPGVTPPSADAAKTFKSVDKKPSEQDLLDALARGRADKAVKAARVAAAAAVEAAKSASGTVAKTETKTVLSVGDDGGALIGGGKRKPAKKSSKKSSKKASKKSSKKASAKMVGGAKKKAAKKASKKASSKKTSAKMVGGAKKKASKKVASKKRAAKKN
jgi:hypothetical protein